MHGANSAAFGEQLHGYGTAYPPQPIRMKGPRKTLNPAVVCLSLFAPFLLFAILAYALTFRVHYDSPFFAQVISVGCLGFVGLLGYLAFAAWRKQAQGSAEPHWYTLLFVTSLLAWLFATVQGTSNFFHNMQPYYDVSSLNVYPSVDPSHFKGQQLMDMGRAIFTADSHLDLTKALGFRNVDVYCVAPIVSGNGTMEVYDFWAVGLNCCSGHKADFTCGEFNNPRAHSGLRLMRDDLRPYFRLAVQQAQAAYKIKSRHPIFMYWMQDPIAEIHAYQDEGYKQYVLSLITCFCVQLVLVMLASVVFSKLG